MFKCTPCAGSCVLGCHQLPVKCFETWPGSACLCPTLLCLLVLCLLVSNSARHSTTQSKSNTMRMRRQPDPSLLLLPCVHVLCICVFVFLYLYSFHNAVDPALAIPGWSRPGGGISRIAGIHTTPYQHHTIQKHNTTPYQHHAMPPPLPTSTPHLMPFTMFFLIGLLVSLQKIL